ncbi:MAG TPA: SufD family Fe-S cluster assembly protein, partial [Rhizomicrobium sp.]
EADLKPELEILADDVKCAHGAAVGDLDADSLFYLKSRGIFCSTPSWKMPSKVSPIPICARWCAAPSPMRWTR